METVDLLDVAKDCVERQKLNAQRSFISLTYLGESARVLGNRDQLDELCPVSYTHLDVYKRQRFAQCDHTAELFLCLRLDKNIRRAADFKGAVGSKGFVFDKADLLRLQLLFQSFHKTGFLYL